MIIRRTKPSPERKAFTLVELLVVIAILALLVVLFLPALETAQQSAKTSACLSNERQMGIAYRMWSADHGEYCLRPPLINNCAGPGDGNFFVAMGRYLNGTTPANFIAFWNDPAADDPPAYSSYGGSTLHYGMATQDPSLWWRDVCSGWGTTVNPLTAKPGGATGPVALGELPYPSSTMVFACKIPRFWPDSGWAGGWYSPMMGLPGFGSNNPPWPLHGTGRLTVNGQTNIGRLDGSARTYAWKEIVHQALTGNAPPAWFTPYTGFASVMNTPRYYLWSGLAPGNPDRTGGWLGE
ncbi:MAG: hypothetical protein PCFJNLEI_02128 [Verrucomicrobiae bacterium]|nr:hypothetical protein [Verrucomicrobiae bacterium]